MLWLQSSLFGRYCLKSSTTAPWQTGASQCGKVQKKTAWSCACTQPSITSRSQGPAKPVSREERILCRGITRKSSEPFICDIFLQRLYCWENRALLLLGSFSFMILAALPSPTQDSLIEALFFLSILSSSIKKQHSVIAHIPSKRISN